MLNISNLSIHYGNRYLFDSVSIAVRPLDRIGLVGRNGTGKSTLLKIITGEELPEEGTVSMPNDYTLGYLAQEMETGSELSIYEETATALVALQELERRIEAIGIELGERTDYESDEYTALVNELTDSDQHFGNLGGHTMEADIEQVLTGLGFIRTDFTRSVNEFSGGWQMRIELAKILLSKPSCILLDEPTNHLDIESIQWLEQFLRNYKGSIIMVSHDRKFLDTVTNRTIEISLGKIYDYNLSYSKFIIQRAEIRKQQQASYVSQQKEIQKTQKYIERFRSKASLATRVQSKVKQLAKVKRVEIDEVDKSRMFFKFPDAPRSGRLIAEAENLSKSYDDNLVLDKINFAIERGEKVA
ncbi:MAG: ABC-F family ATP-binding cassette domain-containing protein, partial [Candidatus Kapabacteria bacterium]|nr:ABC-F family ATP-binding cassette domain-containing protein [Candidatus Kapabacteria bacterium]